MITHVQIKDKIIGENYPTFLIAEMACAHQGDINLALDIVDVAVEAKADAIQLQVFKKESYMSPICKGWDLTCQLEISQDNWLKVIEKIKKEDICFFAAGYDVDSIRFLVQHGVDAFKVHSADTSNPEVLKEVAISNKPIFLSCGASTFKEIQTAIDFLKKNGAKDVILMHGYQAYPTKIENTHLKFIRTLEKKFNLNIGFYDHVEGGSRLAKIIPLMAIGYGAQVVEKHLIMTRENKGIDYESSLDKDNFIDFCSLFRQAEKAVGSKELRDFNNDEIKYRNNCKKSIVARVDIIAGSKITRDKVLFVRNNPGIPPIEFEKIEAKKAKKNIKKYHNLTEDDF